MAEKPLALIAPYPRALWMVMTEETRARMEARLELLIHEHEPVPDEHHDHLDVIFQHQLLVSRLIKLLSKTVAPNDGRARDGNVEFGLQQCCHR